MAIDSDVLVIGGGLAGMTAAIAAADAGAETRLVTASQSTLRQASGLIDVLGYPPSGSSSPTGADSPGGPVPRGDAGAPADDSRGPLVDPFDAVADLPEGHPYERVGPDAIRDGLAAFDAIVEGYAGGHTDANALVPTHGGAVKPTARYPDSTAAGLASDGRDAVLVGFSSLPALDAPLAAAHLSEAGVPFAVDGVTVRFPGELRADATATRYAELLERDELPGGEVEGASATAVSDGGREAASCRAVLADRVADAVDAADVDPQRIGFPAVLGEEHPTEVRAALADRLDAAVFEVPCGPPSLPGIRLERQLRAALRDRDVSVADGRPVVDFQATTDRVDEVHVESAGGGTVPMAAEQYVLATGGLVGTGIEADREAVREPVFDCHVAHPGDRYEWFADDVFGDHPFAAFGVAVDRSLRPLDAADAPEFANLRAAGAVLGGYDLAAEKSGAGVSLATGHAAGATAAKGA